MALRRVEGQLGEEALARGVLPGQQLELIEVAQARVELLVQALEVRPVPLAHQIHLSRPRALRIGERLQQVDQLAASPSRRSAAG